MPADAIAPRTSAARFSRSGRISSRVRATCTRSGEISASPSPKPMSVTRMWSDHRFVTSSTASADSAACTTWRGPRTAIRPWATSRSTRTRPESLVPSDTRPGYGAMVAGPPGAPLVSAASRPAMAANGSRHTWPPSAACHGRGGFGSGGATHRSRFWRPRWAGEHRGRASGRPRRAAGTGSAGRCPACAPRGRPRRAAGPSRPAPRPGRDRRSGGRTPAATAAPAACGPARPARRRPAGTRRTARRASPEPAGPASPARPRSHGPERTRWGPARRVARGPRCRRRAGWGCPARPSSPASLGVIASMPGPCASLGISSCQPGLIRLAMVSLEPSGWTRSLFSSKISR
jgi:hypothetical protein